MKIRTSDLHFIKRGPCCNMLQTFIFQSFENRFIIWYYYLHEFLWEIKIALTILVYNSLDINIVYKQFYYSVVVYYCWICFNDLVKLVLWKKENSSLIGFFSFDRCLKEKKGFWMLMQINKLYGVDCLVIKASSLWALQNSAIHFY